MEVKILNERYNPLMKRREVQAELIHQASGTPSRTLIRKLLASKFKEDVDKVYVIKMVTKTGTHRTVCSVEVYDEKERARTVLPKYILIRNLPPEERKKILEEEERKKKEKLERKR
ncbi:TPA: 30S ribosomal protein S24e [Candidatus Bathyarchaeota archaeon]|nr:30S ribosomal protein S24e [Candidatus Bathyarchaeota archaeon]